jgi:predicted dehydrogenase
MIRIAILSFWHVHAKDYAREAAQHPGVELAAIWDEDAARGQREAEERGIPFVPDLDAVLNDASIDGVVVTTSTAVHPLIIPAAITAKKHVFTEKVLAATLREALELADLAQKAGVALGVALSRTEIPEIVGIRKLIDNGKLGQLTEARVRVAHGGAVPAPGAPNGWLPTRFLEPGEAMGGAMIDLGAHPLYLVRLLLGLPEAVTAAYGRVTGRAADDNAVALLTYANGAIGVAETGFVSKGAPVEVEAHGFEMSAVADPARQEIVIWQQDASGRRVWLSEPFDLSRRATPFDRWVDDIESGSRSSLDLAIDLSALVEAANLSARTGVRVPLAQLDGWSERP